MTRLALVLGGSGSLGTYSGGAVSEILRALERNRREEPVEVRVVTGSSAGALAAATAARGLAVNPDVVPWADRFWLEGFRAEHLLDSRRPDRSGLLDPRPLEEMVGHLVDGPPASDDRPGAALGRSLALGLCLTDMAGTAAGSADRYARRARFRLDAGRGAGDAVWGRIRDASLAAASVPVLFPLRRLARGTVPGSEGEGSDRHWTGDGLAAERPLTLARELAAGFDDHADGDWRYVVVEPRLGREGATSEVPAGVADAARLAARAALGRGAELDLLEAAEEEERAALLRELVERLPEIHGRLEDADAVGLGRRIGQLAERVAEWEVAYDEEDDSGDPALDHLDRSLRELSARPGYAPAFREVGSRAGRTRLAKLVLVLEAAAGLRHRAGHPVHLVSPDRPLEGERMGGFGGLLERSWRAADFAAGRRDARSLLEGELGDVVDYQPDPDDAYRAGETADAPAEGARRRLERHLEAEIDRILDEVRPGGLRGLFFGLVRPALRRSAARRAVEALHR